MAKVAARTARFWLNGFKLASFLQAWEQGVTQNTPDITCLSDDGPRVLPAGYDGSVNFDGLFDGADDQIDEVVRALVGNTGTHALTVIPHGSEAEGSVAYLHIVHNSGQPRRGDVGSAVMLNHGWKDAHGVARGVVLGATTSTGAENRTGQNLGTTTSGQTLRAIFHLFAFSGTSITMTIQQSSDNGSGDAYAAIASMNSGAISTPQAVVTTTTAATEAWKRVALTGTYTSALIGVSLGVVQPSV